MIRHTWPDGTNSATAESAVDEKIPPQLRDELDAAFARPAAQQPSWPDIGAVRAAQALLGTAPPVISPGEIRQLRRELAAVANGWAFLLQGGDCAETFDGNTEEHVSGTVHLLEAMAAELSGSGLRVIKVGRLAGQYAKPRSKPLDVLGLPVYRGDIVNAQDPVPSAREPDPGRLLRAHSQACRTMNHIRTLRSTGGGDVFVSHEALLLDYERPQLRAERSGEEPAELYATSGHFLWVGERTRQLDGAHIALAALLANPVGVKIGPGTTPDEIEMYAERLNPGRIPGKLTFISRMGCDNVRWVLPSLVGRIRRTGHPVVWMCDPMHGNTRESETGYKTRDCADILDEVAGFFEVHRRLGTHPGGVHLELTASDVTECVGVSSGVSDAGLAARYETACDPRLNRDQSLDLARAVTGMLHGGDDG